MTPSSKVDVKVGVFVAAGLAVLIVCILIVGGNKSYFTTQYTLRVRMAQVQGLAPGSVVSLAGVPVGNIKKIVFVPGVEAIELQLDIDKGVQGRITKGSTVSVKTQGALGDKYIFINPGPVTNPMLNDGDLMESENKGDLLDVISDRGGEVSHLFEAIKEAHILLKTLNEDGKIARIRDNLVNSSDDAKQIAIEIRRLIGDIRGNGSGDQNQLKRSIGHLSSILEKIDKGDGTLGALVNDSSLHDSLLKIVGEPARNKFLKPLIRETIRKKELHEPETATTKPEEPRAPSSDSTDY